MKCFKCGKEMGREDNEITLKGIEVTVKLDADPFFFNGSKTITYNNKQLGKYSDGKGGCKVGICYECYIDGLFHTG